MKRLNPETGLEFKKGDKREDGAIFEKYTNRIKKTTGYFSEQWNTTGRVKGKYSINPATGNIYKHGDIGENGKIFRGWDKNRIKANGYYTECWIKKDTHKNRLNKNSKAIKRLNPITGEPFLMGDTREEDNKIFFCYREKITQEGYKKEEWWKPEIYHQKRIEKNYRNHKNKSKRNGIQFDITSNYLIDIFPKDMKCPVLGIKMEWGGSSTKNSPSLDKIIPSKGYVKGNVAWISYKANVIKNDANFKDIMKVAKWLKEHS